MNLIIPPTSLGDVIMATGLPEAYFKCFGEKTYVEGKRFDELWANNPYTSDIPLGNRWNLTHNAKRDYMIYYPVRLFYDMTGLIVHRDLVQPNLYMERKPIEKRVVVSDQAGWPSRRGYPYYNDLINELHILGWEVVYMRNSNFRDCFGTVNEKTLTLYDHLIENPDNKTMLEVMLGAELYIGYESGYCSLAGALKVPYVNLTSSVPPINVCHNSCIYALDICAGYCCSPKCERMCIHHAPNKNEEIIEAIYEK